MKTYPLLLICLWATGYADARNADARTQPAAATFAMNSANATQTDFPARTASIVGKRRPAKAQASFPDISRGVVSEMRATSAFMQKQADTESSDAWLIALAAFGLVALQLRRKHNSLPLRRIRSLWLIRRA